MKCLNHKIPGGSADRYKKQHDMEIKRCQFLINGRRSFDLAGGLEFFSFPKPKCSIKSLPTQPLSKSTEKSLSLGAVRNTLEMLVFLQCS